METLLTTLLLFLAAAPRVMADDAPGEGLRNPAATLTDRAHRPGPVAETIGRIPRRGGRGVDPASGSAGHATRTIAYLTARPAIAEFDSPAMAEVRGFFESRAAHWDDAAKRREAALGHRGRRHGRRRWRSNDAATTGKLHPMTRKALDRMWTVQKPDGGWDWLKCDWPPCEHDDYYGAVFAALGGRGTLPAIMPAADSAQGLDACGRTSGEPAARPAPQDDAALGLDPAGRPDGQDPAGRTIKALRSLQHADGGWSLPSLGDWKRHDGKPTTPPPRATATGPAWWSTSSARRASRPADPAIRRGVAWLKANQRSRAAGSPAR